MGGEEMATLSIFYSDGYSSIDREALRDEWIAYRQQLGNYHQKTPWTDVTLPQVIDIPFSSSQTPSVPHVTVVPQPLFSQNDCLDLREIPGWKAVDDLAGYLVSLNHSITALSTSEIAEIRRLYSHLHAIDQSPTTYSLKSKKKTLPGLWRASWKCSGSAPGQQAAERLFMVHSQAAHRPDVNRVSECVALKLFKEFREAGSRPKDNRGKTFDI
ncbi:uncharacterized protein LOC115412077 [Sphaeramia orbicularis]|uniref:uncharacterized protein LOC115412077 n=1 Tax=Sphaeramia orbicularis TaxID=375764 RepID=UPI00117CA60D|nr:uncharacterized protein LOC115412077 [Sphaeramia orbicularis]